MGQQQLILLALSTVIVGLAIVVGIRAFSENSVKSNSDAMIQDAVRIANDLQAWKQKPAPFGGQASSDGVTATDVAASGNFKGATFAALGYAATGSGATAVYSNLNGSFRIESVDDGAGATVRGVNTQQANEVVVEVTGLSDTDINGTIDCLGGKQPTDGGDCTVTDLAGAGGGGGGT